MRWVSGALLTDEQRAVVLMLSDWLERKPHIWRVEAEAYMMWPERAVALIHTYQALLPKVRFAELAEAQQAKSPAK